MLKVDKVHRCQASDSPQSYPSIVAATGHPSYAAQPSAAIFVGWDRLAMRAPTMNARGTHSTSKTKAQTDSHEPINPSFAPRRLDWTRGRKLSSPTRCVSVYYFRLTRILVPTGVGSVSPGLSRSVLTARHSARRLSRIHIALISKFRTKGKTSLSRRARGAMPTALRVGMASTSDRPWQRLVVQPKPWA
jgi:hypothetical protein